MSVVVKLSRRCGGGNAFAPSGCRVVAVCIRRGSEANARGCCVLCRIRMAISSGAGLYVGVWHARENLSASGVGSEAGAVNHNKQPHRSATPTAQQQRRERRRSSCATQKRGKAPCIKQLAITAAPLLKGSTILSSYTLLFTSQACCQCKIKGKEGAVLVQPRFCPRAPSGWLIVRARQEQ